MSPQLFACAHSTGATVLLDYLIAHGDADFDGFVFNSPFLSWGWDLDGALFKAAMSVAPQVDA